MMQRSDDDANTAYTAPWIKVRISNTPEMTSGWEALAITDERVSRKTPRLADPHT